MAGLLYEYFRGDELSYWQFVRVWWFSDGTGLMIVTPLVLSFWPIKPAQDLSAKFTRMDVAVGVLALAALAFFVTAYIGPLHHVHVRPVQLLPFVVYAGARLSPRITTLVLVTFATAILWVAHRGYPLFGDLPIRETILLTQQTVLIMTVTSLGLSALLSQLRANAAHLEARVQRRTAQLREANEQLRKLASTDALTGVLNRRALLDVLDHEMERHRRHARPLAVVMIDLDEFKPVNDKWGHAMGDTVLQGVANLFSDAIRNSDVLGRYGGEEFVLIAPETDAQQAAMLCERLRAALNVAVFPAINQSLRITANFSVITLRHDDCDPAILLHRADDALYQAKAAGHNRVVMKGLSKTLAMT